MPLRSARIWGWGRRKMLGVAALALTAIVGLEAGRVLLGDNFHVVLPGQVYRGAQRSPDDLEKLVKKLGIRTVVNLRGLCNPSPWYVHQVRCIQQLGISQQDISMSASRLPPAQEMRRLVEIIDKAEHPIYFHCRRGADRTGLASVVAKILLTDCTWNEARGQLNWRYGHVAIGRLAYIDEFFEIYTRWLQRHEHSHSRENFRHWITHVYRGSRCHYDVEEFRPLTSPQSAPLTASLHLTASLRAAVPLGPVNCVIRGTPIAYSVKLRNTGRKAWNLTTHSRAGFHLGYRVWDTHGKLMLEGRSFSKEVTVERGGVYSATLVLQGELPKGRYRIMVDLVEESLSWFYQMGTEPMEGELDVCEEYPANRR